MKLLRISAFSVAIAMLFCHSAQAQYRLLGKPVVHSFGSHLTGAPVLHRAKAFGGYEIRFPGARLPAASLENADSSAVNDRLNIAPGVEIRVSVTKDLMLNDKSPPPVITAAGHPLNLDIGKYLTDPALWPHSALNENEYYLSAGWFARNVYRYLGLAKSFSKSYLGVCWYSPRASGNPDGAAVVFQIEWLAGGTLKLTPVKAVSGQDITPSVVLDTLPGGTLVLYADGKLSQMNQRGEWAPVPDSAGIIKKNLQFARSRSFWHRGKWLLIGSVSCSGRTCTTTITVQNNATRRKAREFKWRYVDER
jgi:hypothetical protein